MFGEFVVVVNGDEGFVVCLELLLGVGLLGVCLEVLGVCLGVLVVLEMLWGGGLCEGVIGVVELDGK